MFEIKKNNQPISIGGGGIDVSKDSCAISFLELTKNRVKNGIVGHAYKINVCKSEISSQKVIKPQWPIGAKDSMTITPLDSVIYNNKNPWQPIIVTHYNLGKPVKLHHKMVEGFLIFFNDAYFTTSSNQQIFRSFIFRHFNKHFAWVKNQFQLSIIGEDFLLMDLYMAEVLHLVKVLDQMN